MPNTSSHTAYDPLAGSSANPEEIARFTAMADEWWDPKGKFRPLHQINPLRTAFILGNAVAHFGLDGATDKPLAGLDVVDVGCGGGILSEQMAALGANVTGIDAGAKNIEIAKIHSGQSGLDINYINTLPEDLMTEGKRFDVVLNMEIIEHVSDPEIFMAASTKLLKENGVMVLSTLNRTIKSLLLAKIGAEYILRWLPAGTHTWGKFIKPSELARLIRPHGMEFTKIVGVIYNPLKDSWSISKNDLDVNYMAFAKHK
ncbi:MAG: bifunctional 2-polyprenyl-6-hydroxyphenol methylase/3-demethylubiquinol 3-O-methyltransferase UbiG [Rhodospirillaceae bacterium]|nr:bifunctional 2-polyprenyl-6-hydroxyphenol methylase/3-demethylubiquinol 3-O-methyltransferase UbiG [Rhodospirillaceae bacterium]